MSETKRKTKTKYHTSKAQSDNVYYNVTVRNEGGVNDPRLLPAQFNENRVEPILVNPSEYELGVIRFTVPAINIPIFLWGDAAVHPDWFVCMEFDGVIIQKNLTFIANAATPDIYGNAIWAFHEFVEIINVAMSDAFTDLKAAKPLAPPTATPTITFDPNTDLLTLFAEQLYDSSTVTIKIWFSENLFNFVPSFLSYDNMASNDVQRQRQILVKNLFNNIPTTPANYYFMTQEYSTLFLWNSITNIVFETSSIPVESEFIQSQKNVTRRIITDFEISTGINNKDAFQYFPSGPIRYYDMISNYPMSRMDVKVFWESNKGDLYPVYISKGEVLSIKIQFRKKKKYEDTQEEDNDNI